jgi:hypothetical protein
LIYIEAQELENISFGVPIGESASEWTVKKELQPGDDYFIVISSSEKGGFRMTSERFSVGKGGAKGLGNEAIPCKRITSFWALGPVLAFIGLLLL